MRCRIRVGMAMAFSIALALPVPEQRPALAAQTRPVGGNVIDRVSTATMAERTTLTLHGAKTPSFTAYRLDSPPRLVVDVAHAQLLIAPRERQVLVDSWAVSTLQLDERKGDAIQTVRVLIGLKRDASYTVAPSGQDLVITIIPSEVPKDTSADLIAAQRAKAEVEKELSRLSQEREKVQSQKEALALMQREALLQKELAEKAEKEIRLKEAAQQAERERLLAQQREAKDQLEKARAEQERAARELSRLEGLRAHIEEREKELGQQIQTSAEEASQRLRTIRGQLSQAESQAAQARAQVAIAQQALAEAEQRRARTEQAQRAEAERLNALLAAQRQTEGQLAEQARRLKEQQAELSRLTQLEKELRREASQKRQREVEELLRQAAAAQQRTVEEIGRLRQVQAERIQQEKEITERLAQAERESQRLTDIRQKLRAATAQAEDAQRQLVSARQAMSQADEARRKAEAERRAEELRLSQLLAERKQVELQLKAQNDLMAARREEVARLEELQRARRNEEMLGQKAQQQRVAVEEELKKALARRQRLEQDLSQMEKARAERIKKEKLLAEELERAQREGSSKLKRTQEELALASQQALALREQVRAAQQALAQTEAERRRAEAEKQALLKETEAERRRAEAEKQALLKETEAERRRAEAEKQALLKETEAERRRAEAEKQALLMAQAEQRRSLLELRQKAELERKAEQARLDALRQEQQRLEAARRELIAAQAEQQRKLLELKEKAEQERRAEQAQLDALRQANRQAEAERQVLHIARMEQARKLEQLRQEAELDRQAEQARKLAAEQEQQRTEAEKQAIHMARLEQVRRLEQARQQEALERKAELERVLSLRQMQKPVELERHALGSERSRTADVQAEQKDLDEVDPRSAWRPYRQAVTLRPYAHTDGPSLVSSSSPREAGDERVAPASYAMGREGSQRALAKAASGAEPARGDGVLVPVVEVRFEDDGRVGRVVVILGGNNVETAVYSDDKTAVLRLVGAQLPKGLSRTLDASAYGGPVQSVSSFQDPRNSRAVRLVVSMRQRVSPTLHRQGVRLSWEFPRGQVSVLSLAAPRVAGFGILHTLPLQAPPPPGAAPAGGPPLPGGAINGGGIGARGPVSAGKRFRRYEGRRIDLDFRQADIHNILRLLSDVGQVNIVTSDDVKGEVTIRMRDVPWDQALDVVLKAKGLGYVREGNLIRVAPQEKLDKEAEAEMARLKNKAEIQPIETRLIPLSYADAGKMSKRVEDILSPRGKVSVDERTNVLIISDMSANIALAEDLLRNLDTPIPQVLIEARIVEARANFVRDVGIQWGGNYLASTATGNPTGLVFPSSVGLGGGATDQQTDLSIRNGLGPNATNPNYLVNLPAPVGTGSGGALGISLGSITGNANINLRLSAFENSGNVRVISAPKIITTDNFEASIEQGVSIPVSVVSAAGTNTQFFDAKLNLTVKPRVTNDGSVLMDIKVTRNEPDFANTGARGDPSILKREAKTNMLVRDGDTAVIGGIYTRNTGQAYQKVPWLAEIPILGWLFKNRRDNDDRNELLIFITPRIMNRPGQGQASGAGR